MVKKAKLSRWDLIKIQGQDILERAGWTFIQAFAGSLSVIFATTDINERKALIISALASAGASALSAIKTSIKTILDN